MLLYTIELLTIICYWVKVFDSCGFLEDYSTKHLCAGISVYFHPSFNIAIIYFKPRYRYHMMFEFIKIILSLVYLRKSLIFMCGFAQSSYNSAKFQYKLLEILYKA